MDDPASQVSTIKALLESDSIETVTKGLAQLKKWVDDCNESGEADLSLFGYQQGFGQMVLNPLFDELLEKFGDQLSVEAISNLVDALFMENEEYMDCAAALKGMEILLRDRQQEPRVIAHIQRGLSGYGFGHRFNEESMLDQLIERILPTFSANSLTPFLESIHTNFLNASPDGDNAYPLIVLALKKAEDESTRSKLEGIVIKLFKEHWVEDKARDFYLPFFKDVLSPSSLKEVGRKPKKQQFSGLLKKEDLDSLIQALEIACDLPPRTVQEEATLLCKRIHMHGSKVPYDTFLKLAKAALLKEAETAQRGTYVCTRHFIRCALNHHHKKMMNALIAFCQEHPSHIEGFDKLLEFSLKDPLPGERDKLEKYSFSQASQELLTKRIETIRQRIRLPS